MTIYISTELSAGGLKAANYVLRAYGLPEQSAPASVASIMSAIAPGMELGKFTQIVRVLSKTIEDIAETEAS